jgi:hypothetical protein
MPSSCSAPYYTIPFHTIPFHTIPFHTIPFRTIYHTNHTIPANTLLSHASLPFTHLLACLRTDLPPAGTLLSHASIPAILLLHAAAALGGFRFYCELLVLRYWCAPIPSQLLT